MKKSWLGAAPVILLAISVSVRADVEIEHDPVACSPLDRYLRLTAKGSPAGKVTSADLQFRVDASSAWYSVHMTPQGEVWSAVLPRPAEALARFEYRIVMTSRELGTTATSPFVVRVSTDHEECPSPAESSVSSSIVVTVPPGAPVVPPVPPGFSPTGVVSDAKLKRPDSRKTLKILAGAGVAGGIVALAGVGGATTPPVETDIPEFFFDGTSPSPGSVLSLGHDALTVFVRMSREPRAPLTFTWRLEMQAETGSPVCLVMTDLFVGAQSPPSLSLFAPLSNTGQCGDRFDVNASHLTIQVEARRVLDLTLELPFHVEP